MTNETVRDAMKEAERFLQAARNALAVTTPVSFFYGTKESGALRRASMDLTRALAEMRKP